MVALGKYFPIKIPKVVSIQNGKLSCFQLVVQVVVVSLLLYQFIGERMYLVVKIPQGFPNAWVQVADATLPAVQRDYQGQICQGSAEFLYKYSTAFTHGSYQCLETAATEAGYKIGKREIYFPTYYRETRGRQSSGTGCDSLCPGALACNDTSYTQPPRYDFGYECIAEKRATIPVWNSTTDIFSTQSVRTCTCSTRAHYLVAGVSSRAMGFEHIFKVSDQETEVSGASGGSKAVADADENKLPVLTIIMTKKDDGKYEEFDCFEEKKRRDASVSGDMSGRCRFFENDAVWMTLEDWVTAASGGKINLADPDARNSHIAANLAPGYSSGDRRMAAFRLTGVEVLVSLEYVGPEFHGNIPESVDLDGFEDYMVALVKLSVNDAMWTGLPQTAYGSPAPSAVAATDFHTGSFRERYHYGIRFLFMTSTSSAYGAFSMMDLLTGLAVFKVYFGAAGAVVALFALYALGQLSVQYKRAVEQPLDVKKEAATIVPAKLLIAVAAYRALERAGSAEQQAGGGAVQKSPRHSLTAGGAGSPGDEGTLAAYGAAAGASTSPRPSPRTGSRSNRTNNKFDERVLRQCLVDVFGSGEHVLRGSGIDALVETVLLALGDYNKNMDLESFVEAFLAHDALDLNQFQNMFDAHRKVGRLEQYFSTPLDLTVWRRNILLLQAQTIFSLFFFFASPVKRKSYLLRASSSSLCLL
ncbi:unnamed protein product [Amoebophrya sp. A120]|nr:unnamed protein product [Amoebophrya sp. A120]|eukprot:GSA120T00015155001.1